MFRSFLTVLALVGPASVCLAGSANAPAPSPQQPPSVTQPAPFPGPAKIGGVPSDPSDCRYSDTCSNGG